MIRQHDDIPFPDDDTQTLWRFTEFAEFVGLLELGRLPVRRSDGLVDTPSATTADDGSMQHLIAVMAQAGARPRPAARGRLERWWAEKEQEQDRNALIEAMRTARLPTIVWIDRWHAADADEALFWRLYARSDTTVALRSSVGALRDALQPTDRQTVSLGLVRYGDTPRSAESPAAALVGRKVDAFERELRVLVTDIDPERAGCPATLGLAVDPHLLVGGVHVPPSAPPMLIELVQSLMQRYALAAPCQISALGAAPDNRLPMLVSNG